MDTEADSREVHFGRVQGIGIVAGVTALGTAVDQTTKAWALARLTEGERVPFLGELLQFHLVFNPGAAFSLGTSVTWVFGLLAVVALGVLLGWVAPRVRRWPWAIAAGLFGAGIAGNLVDRLLRPPGVLVGHVVDFLELPHWPIFNVADMCICVGAGLLAVLSIGGKRAHDGSLLRAPRDAAATTSEGARDGERLADS